MIIGIGLDIVEIDRIDGVLKRQPAFVKRILTEEEQRHIPDGSAARITEYIAGRFAAKEAMAKALGTGIGSALRFHDIEVVREETGKPAVRLASHILERYTLARGILRIHLSISHSKEYAAAQVIIEQV